MSRRELVQVLFIDSPAILDASVTNIPASTSPPLQLVASLSKTVYAITIHNGIGGEFVALYQGASGHETLICGSGLLSAYRESVQLASGTRISIRSLGAKITKGSLLIQFLSTPNGL